MNFNRSLTLSVCLLAVGMIVMFYIGQRIAGGGSRHPLRLTVQPAEFAFFLDEMGGQSAIGKPIGAEVRLTNTGQQPIAIADILTSCQCTLAESFDPTPLPSGDTRTLQLTVRPPAHGTQRSVVTILTDPPTIPVQIAFNLTGASVSTPFISRMPGPIQLVAEARNQPVIHNFSVETGEQLGTSEYWLRKLQTEDPDVFIELTGVEDVRQEEVKQLLVRRYDFQLQCTVPADGPAARTFLIHPVKASPAGTSTNEQPILVRLSLRRDHETTAASSPAE